VKNEVAAGKDFVVQAEIISGINEIKSENWPHFVGKKIQGV